MVPARFDIVNGTLCLHSHKVMMTKIVTVTVILMSTEPISNNVKSFKKIDKMYLSLSMRSTSYQFDQQYLGLPELQAHNMNLFVSYRLKSSCTSLPECNVRAI